MGGGFASLALIDLLERDAHAASGNPLAAKAPHFPAKAKHAVFLFMNGAPSHIDTFDPKPGAVEIQRDAVQGIAGSRLERPAYWQSDAVAVRVPQLWTKRSSHQQPFPTYFEVRR